LRWGASLVRDSFHAVTWKDRQRGDATLASVPSVVMVHWKDEGSINFNDKMITTAALTNAGMLLLLAGGSVIWWLKSGRGRGMRTSAHGDGFTSAEMSRKT